MPDGMLPAGCFADLELFMLFSGTETPVSTIWSTGVWTIPRSVLTRQALRCMAVACCSLQCVTTINFLLQSWLCGKVIGRFDPAAVALNSSSGYETPFSKSLMRWTVIAADILGESCCVSAPQASTLLLKELLMLLLLLPHLGLGRLRPGCGKTKLVACSPLCLQCTFLPLY